MNDRKNIGKKNILSYDACNISYPVNIVIYLFDSYEKDKIIAEEKNEKYRHNLILRLDTENSN